MTTVLAQQQQQVARPEDAFQDFFRSYPFGNEPKYRKRLAQVAVNQGRSLVVDFEDLISFDPDLARRLVTRPDEYVLHAERAAISQMKVEDPEYAELVGKIFVRFRRLPDKESLRKIGAEHLNRMVLVDGIIVRVGQVKPTIVKAHFQCLKCMDVIVEDQEGEMMRGPAGSVCPLCKQHSAFKLLEDESVFKNTQEARVQERPEDLPPGQLPRYMDVKLEYDMVDSGRPGDRVSITSIVRAQREYYGEKGKLRTFTLFFDANCIDIMGKETELIEISPDDEKKILEVATDPWIQRNLVASIAPSIYGYENVKEAILYLLCGGVQKQMPDGVTIRGDSNVLLIGDPGVAKSQMLQYVARTAPRGLYTSGRGSSAAGLTAAVLREKTGGMVLEAGALVLADKGVAAVDELDKMKPEDRVAIHEALEQQTVSIAKGGIVATLNARAAVLAAANPALGRYEPHRNVSENINLPITILSRFDLIFILRDTPDKELDAQMSQHILSLHKTLAGPESPFPIDFLRKYISYAKRTKPTLGAEAVKELSEFYMKMRAKSNAEGAAIAITPRQLEAIVRLAEARARALLHREVSVEDAKAAIRLMTVSLQDVGIDVSTGSADIDVIMTGTPKSTRDKYGRILDVITELSKESGSVEESVLYSVLADKHNITEGEARQLVRRLLEEGTIFSPTMGRLKKTVG